VAGEAWSGLPEESGAGAVFDVRTGDEVFGFERWNDCCPNPFARGVSWSPDGRLVAVSTEDTATVWDVASHTLRDTLRGHGGLVLGLAWSPDSKRLVTGGSDGTAKVWEIGPQFQEQWSLSARDE
jgi:WD40 repeat protein